MVKREIHHVFVLDFHKWTKILEQPKNEYWTNIKGRREYVKGVHKSELPVLRNTHTNSSWNSISEKIKATIVLELER